MRNAPISLIVLTILFTVLKLSGEVTWDWFRVLSPIIIPVGLGVIVAMAKIIGQSFEK